MTFDRTSRPISLSEFSLPTDNNRAIVVGGGLAGLTTATKLVELGIPTLLLEMSHSLGGKAGTRVVDGIAEDHGFHVFPSWYTNTWAIIDAAGARTNFAPNHIYYQLRLGEFPRFRKLRAFSVRTALANLFYGAASPPTMYLALFLMLDTALRFSDPDLLAGQSIGDFLRSRFYMAPRLDEEVSDMLQAAHAITGDDAEASVLAGIAGPMIAAPHPMAFSPVSDLGSALIDPLTARLVRLGGVVSTQSKVSDLIFSQGSIRGVACKVGDEQRNLYAPIVVLTIPPIALRDLLSIKTTLERSVPTLARASHLPQRQLASLHLSVAPPMGSLPNEHIRLVKSRYSITMLDVSDRGASASNSQRLNLVLGNYTELSGLDVATTIQRVLSELLRFGLRTDGLDVHDVLLQPHKSAQLFTPLVGTWDVRPTARTEVSGLYIAGDYCRTWVVLPTMEAAVVSGMQTAEAIRADVGLLGSVAPSKPPTIRRGISTAMWLPSAAIASIAGQSLRLLQR